MKLIRCPHCQSACAVGLGYYHDEKLNIHCKLCRKIIFATSEEDEEELVRLYARPVRDEYNYRTHHMTNPYPPPATASHNPAVRHNQHNRHVTNKELADFERDGYD